MQSYKILKSIFVVMLCDKILIPGFNLVYILPFFRNENNNKLKHRVLLNDIWLSDCFDTIFWQYKADTSFVIGWPPATNYIADFKDNKLKDTWLKRLKE